MHVCIRRAPLVVSKRRERRQNLGDTRSVELFAEMGAESRPVRVPGPVRQSSSLILLTPTVFQLQSAIMSRAHRVGPLSLITPARQQEVHTRLAAQTGERRVSGNWRPAPDQLPGPAVPALLSSHSSLLQSVRQCLRFCLLCQKLLHCQGNPHTHRHCCQILL